jgi:hypothetical protein
MMMERVSEKEVVALWGDSVSRGVHLTTVDRQPVRVIYPGRPGGAPGSDFQDAVVILGQQVVKGNIEVHVRASDWHAHGHHRDTAYNGVVLHVVLHDDVHGLTPLENSRRIPVVALEGTILPEATLGENPPGRMPCRGRLTRGRDEAVAGMLDSAGEERFREKVAACRRELKAGERGQVFYLLVMGALGYSRNREAFQALADGIRLQALVDAICRGPPGEAVNRAEALLLGAAGFLPSQRPNGSSIWWADDPYLCRLEDLWSAGGKTTVLSLRDWRLFRVRPGNHPLRRLAGMARLLHRYRGHGLQTGFQDLVESAPPERGWGALEQGLIVAADGYWREHYDFGKTGPEVILIGRERAADIVINVVLPFSVALAEITQSPELEAKSAALYAVYPAGQWNAIERHMCQQLAVPAVVVNTARRRQGLLHLYKRYCTEGRCRECPLGNLN